MVRLFHIFFPGRTLLLVSSETMLVVAALLAATMVSSGPEADLALAPGQGMLKIGIATLVCMTCMHYYDLYDSFVLQRPGESVTRLLQVLGTVCLVLAMVYYIYPGVQLSRNRFLLGLFLMGGLLTGWRRLFAALNGTHRLDQSTVLLGDGPLAGMLAEEIRIRPELGIGIAGFVDAGAGGAIPARPCLGQVEDLPSLVEQRGIRRIVLTLGERRGKLPIDLLLRLKTQGVVIDDAADLYEEITGKLALCSLRAGWLLFSPGFRPSRVAESYKRVGSILLSLAGLLAALPILIAVALAIRLESPGPVIFRQQRVGKGGRIFTLFKFRSMLHDADPIRPAQANDRRFTRVGGIIRRIRLDEIPQLLNILRGDMHFIGPRPFTPELEEEYSSKIPYYNQRWSVTPGLTGWAQIHNGYCATVDDNREKLSYDLYYIKNMSVGLDFVILLQTIKILLLGRGSR